MSHFTKALEEGLREIDESVITVEDWANEPPAISKNASLVIKSRLTQFAEKIRQAVAEDDVEWCEGNKSNFSTAYKSESNEVFDEGYNQALTDFITHKREQLTKE